jgi:hypothetical protein
MHSFLDIDILNCWGKFDSKARTCKYTRKKGERKEDGYSLPKEAILCKVCWSVVLRVAFYHGLSRLHPRLKSTCNNNYLFPFLLVTHYKMQHK